VRVQLALDFHDLNTIHPPPNTILLGEYYIQLHQYYIYNQDGNTLIYVYFQLFLLPDDFFLSACPTSSSPNLSSLYDQ
jgi:hypothetical protein